MNQRTAGHFLLPAAAACTLLLKVPAWAALASGMAIALLFGNPYLAASRRLTPRLLQASVVGLGAGMNLATVANTGLHGIGYTLAGILLTFAAGLALGKGLGTSRDSSVLITSGTAICGGSAIAAVAPVLRAKPQDISIALGTVFLLNSLALVLFPWAGQRIGLSQEQFGLWCALAIHDTSSVVGAALQYGTRALEVATTVKLARALWIVPLTLAISSWIARRETPGEQTRIRPKRPWFILGFVVATAVTTWAPALEPAGRLVEQAARRALVLTLLLIGAGLTPAALREVGPRPFVQGLALWLAVAAGALAAILGGVVAVT